MDEDELIDKAAKIDRDLDGGPHDDILESLGDAIVNSMNRSPLFGALSHLSAQARYPDEPGPIAVAMFTADLFQFLTEKTRYTTAILRRAKSAMEEDGEEVT